MIQRIARKEMTEMLRDGRFRLASAIVGVLLLASLSAGWKHYSDIRAQHAAAQQAERRNWLKQDWHVPGGSVAYLWHRGSMIVCLSSVCRHRLMRS